VVISVPPGAPGQILKITYFHPRFLVFFTKKVVEVSRKFIGVIRLMDNPLISVAPDLVFKSLAKFTLVAIVDYPV